MGYNLKIFGETFFGVDYITATDTSNVKRTYTLGTLPQLQTKSATPTTLSQTIEAVPSGTVTGDIVFVKIT